ncbi:glycerol-3-phosphate 1-O-acyltransferase PlsY [Aquirufa ecclesiirivi]|uniref:glycerol-3-phosphate 1-O-acyltransferase PlsY n=1 Tax=Aquirufa ecclesiirivi TaxID=2715124 RepID=UPI0022A880AE|nr:glycerol-3-phosphate 1-O-acyltransferase PlsY [Aquirufa ecclesiirivi]MCZ2471569.1 glycerol-3-phosphate 1-O-acyltransferase PlsY [Aquirufa ecclesiirivi]
MILILIGLCLLSYILGSIPTAIWYGEAYYGVDIRTLGSGNAGATNTFRVLGKKAGSIVLFVDAFKGFLATSLSTFLFYLHLIDWQTCVSLKIVFGFLAVLGHLLPVFCDFKGGKGVATLMGMVLALHPEAALVSIAVFLLVFYLSNYVSLGSMVASLVFPSLMVFKVFGDEFPILIYFGFIVAFLVIFMHRKNIARILQGTENRMYLIPRKKQS